MGMCILMRLRQRKIRLKNTGSKEREQNKSPKYMNSELLIDIVTMRMPFGKYEGRLICDLPVSYLEWFQRKGYPKGKIGVLLETMHVVKTNGLDEILIPIKEMAKKK